MPLTTKKSYINKNVEAMYVKTMKSINKLFESFLVIVFFPDGELMKGCYWIDFSLIYDVFMRKKCQLQGSE